MTLQQLARRWREKAALHIYEAAICGGGHYEELHDLAAAILEECADELDNESDHITFTLPDLRTAV